MKTYQPQQMEFTMITDAQFNAAMNAMCQIIGEARLRLHAQDAEGEAVLDRVGTIQDTNGTSLAALHELRCLVQSGRINRSGWPGEVCEELLPLFALACD
jgi:hypothetical protein